MGKFSRALVYSLQVSVFVLVLTGLVSGRSFAQTVTFDTLPQADTQITAPYDGYTWTNFGALAPAYYGYNNGFSNGVVSGTNVGFSWDGGQVSTVSSSSPFSLTSGYFTGAWNEANSVTVIGYVNGVSKFTTTFLETPTAPTLEQFSWSNLTSISFLASNGGQFVVDKLSLNATSTPEPTTLAAMIIGLMCLVGLRFYTSRLRIG